MVGVNKLVGKLFNAHFIRGLGTGLIIAALLFIAWPSKELLTDEQIRERAGQLGMVEPKSQTPSGTPQPDSSVAKAPTTEKTTPEAPVQQKPASEVPAAESTKPGAPKPSEQEIITIVVPKGANSDDIADSLAAKGLITDQQTFEDVVNRLGVASKFKVGTFNFHKGMDTTEIILQMTRK